MKFLSARNKKLYKLGGRVLELEDRMRLLRTHGLWHALSQDILEAKWKIKCLAPSRQDVKDVWRYRGRYF